VRDERTDDQADPEQRDQKPKHGSPFVRVFRGNRNAPVKIHEGIGENRRQTRAQFKFSNLRGQVSRSQEVATGAVVLEAAPMKR
jgi:hypothetical protein